MVRPIARGVGILLLACVALARAAEQSVESATAPAEPPPGVVRVACVGDSITYGMTIKNRERDSYPARLGPLLGETYAVRNFGVNGTTALATGDRPYRDRPVYAKALAFKADVVVIGLGTNDTKPQNWTNADKFAADYKAIIADFKKANPAAKVFVCLPVQCYLEGEWSIRDRIIKDEVIPAIRRIASDVGATPIDLRSALEGKKELLPDAIHPNAEGAAILANTVATALKN